MYGTTKETRLRVLQQKIRHKGANPFIRIQIWHVLHYPAKALCVHTIGIYWHTEFRMFLVVFMHTEGCAFPSLFLCIIYDTSSFQTIVGRLREEEVL